MAEKSFAVGTLAESIQALGAASAQFVSRLLPVLLSSTREVDPEVRSNAIFGLGVLAEHGGHPAQEYPWLAEGGWGEVGRVFLGLRDPRGLPGCLFLDCGTRHFPKLLGLLLPLLARERHDRVCDNICGALARLLMASPTRKPEPQVRNGGIRQGQ